MVERLSKDELRELREEVLDAYEKVLLEQQAKQIFAKLKVDFKTNFEDNMKEYKEKGYNTAELESHYFVSYNLIRKVEREFK